MPTAANLAIKEIDKTPGENQPRGFFATTVVVSHNGNAICPPEPNQQAVYVNA